MSTNHTELDALAIAAGLREAANACTRFQLPLKLRLEQAADVLIEQERLIEQQSIAVTISPELLGETLGNLTWSSRLFRDAGFERNADAMAENYQKLAALIGLELPRINGDTALEQIHAIG